MATEYFNDAWRIPNNKNQSLVSNYSMQFLRANATQLNVPTTSNFAFGTGGFTISLWINFTIKHLNSTLLDFRSLSVLNNQPSLSFNLTNGVQWRRQGVSPAILPINIPSSEFTVGNWNNIVVLNNGSTTKLYLDGVEKGSTTDSVNYNASCPLTVGQNIDGSSYWTSALFDEIAIFNYALSASQVATLYGGGTAVTNPLSLSPKPIAYYQLGDQSVSTGPSADYLVPNNSLQDYVFDFSSDRIAIPSYTLTENSTVSLWVNFDTTPSVGEVLLGGVYGVRYMSIKSYLGNFQVLISASGQSSFFTTNTSFLANTWYHVCIIQDSYSATLYINGEAPSSGSTGNPLPPTLTTIGAFSTGAESLNGQMSNVALFSTKLPATGTESVASLYNNGSPALDISSYSGLQRWYKLNAQDTFDGSNWTIKDYANNQDGSSVNMTSANLVQSNLQHTSGYSPYALSLDGINDYIDLSVSSSSSVPSEQSSWTYSAWLYLDSTHTSAPTIFQRGQPYPQKGLLVRESNGNIQVYFLATGITFSTNKLLTNVWSHFALVYDISTNELTCYINNSSQTLTMVSGWSISGTLFNIGFRQNNSGYWKGEMSNVAIWNTNLSTTEITEIYNQGVPSNLNTFSGIAPVSWWQLGSNSSFNPNPTGTEGTWTCLDEIGTNNGVSDNSMTNDAITNGVGYSANGLGTSSIEIVGDAPYSTANGISENMDVLDRTTDVPG